MFNFIKGMLIGLVAGWLTLGYFAWSRHVVRTPEGWRVVAKDAGSFDRVYVDMRAWGALDYMQNREVLRALARDGWQQSQASADAAFKDAKQQLEKGVDELQREMDSMLRKR